MTWYEPTGGYSPDEIAEELGLDVMPTDEIGPDIRPLGVYAGAFRPAAPMIETKAAEAPRALATSDRR